MAWEAILSQKPVIAFGPLCYDFCDRIFRCTEVEELPALLPQVLKRFKPDHGLVLRLVDALLDSAHEGEWNVPLRLPSAGSPEDYRRVARAIAQEVELTQRNGAATRARNLGLDSDELDVSRGYLAES